MEEDSELTLGIDQHTTELLDRLAKVSRERVRIASEVERLYAYQIKLYERIEVLRELSETTNLDHRQTLIEYIEDAQYELHDLDKDKRRLLKRDRLLAHRELRLRQDLKEAMR